MSKYYPPIHRETKFHCAHCDVYANQHWGRLWSDLSNHSILLECCKCDHCNELTYWYRGDMIFPRRSTAPPPHKDMPQTILAEYDEASSVLSLSPKAAAALLRLALQKLMQELKEAGKHLDTDIKALVAKGLPTEVQKAMDICRIVG